VLLHVEKRFIPLEASEDSDYKMAGFIESYYAWADVTGVQILEWAADSKFVDGKGQAIFPRPTKVSFAEHVDIFSYRSVLVHT
jgi:hypothetical protein